MIHERSRGMTLHRGGPVGPHNRATGKEQPKDIKTISVHTTFHIQIDPSAHRRYGMNGLVLKAIGTRLDVRTSSQRVLRAMRSASIQSRVRVDANNTSVYLNGICQPFDGIMKVDLITTRSFGDTVVYQIIAIYGRG